MKDIERIQAELNQTRNDMTELFKELQAIDSKSSEHAEKRKKEILEELDIKDEVLYKTNKLLGHMKLEEALKKAREKGHLTLDDITEVVRAKTILLSYDKIKKSEAEPTFELLSKIFEESTKESTKSPEIAEMIQQFTSQSDTQIQIKEEVLKTRQAENYIMPNNKLINKLSSGEICEGKTGVQVMEKPAIVTQITIEQEDENVKMLGTKEFTPYDRAVYNAVCTIWEAGNKFFTANQVYRTMNGLTNGEYVTPERVETITESIDKARTTSALIDYTNEYKQYNKGKLKEGESITIENHLLSASKINIKAGGNQVEGYRLESTPILYEYAKVSRQVIAVPIELLKTVNFLNNTDEITVLREYLIRRIEVMKADSKKKIKKQSNKIKLDSLYEAINLKDINKQKARTIRNHTKALLDNYKKVSYIKDYEFKKKGRAYDSIEITLND